jgi:hypothetical protein
MKAPVPRQAELKKKSPGTENVLRSVTCFSYYEFYFLIFMERSMREATTGKN